MRVSTVVKTTVLSAQCLSLFLTTHFLKCPLGLCWQVHCQTEWWLWTQKVKSTSATWGGALSSRVTMGVQIEVPLCFWQKMFAGLLVLFSVCHLARLSSRRVAPGFSKAPKTVRKPPSSGNQAWEKSSSCEVTECSAQANPGNLRWQSFSQMEKSRGSAVAHFSFGLGQESQTLASCKCAPHQLRAARTTVQLLQVGTCRGNQQTASAHVAPVDPS